MICSPCGNDNAAARRFCGQCGINLYAVCTHCGFENVHTDRFCGGCGDALPAAGVHARPARAATPAPTPVVRAVAAMPPPAPVAVAPAHVAVAAVPPPAPVLVPSPKATGRTDDLLSSSELSDLLRRPAAPAAAPEAAPVDLPEGAITQESLDALFGG